MVLWMGGSNDIGIGVIFTCRSAPDLLPLKSGYGVFGMSRLVKLLLG